MERGRHITRALHSDGLTPPVNAISVMRAIKETNSMRLWLLLTFSLFGLLWPGQGSGCSSITIPPIDVDPEEFVFIGTVTELTELPGHESERDPIVGVRVLVRESHTSTAMG